MSTIVVIPDLIRDQRRRNSEPGTRNAEPGTFISLRFPLSAFRLNRGISSVGLERYLDRVEVTGSNPVCPTRMLLYDECNICPILGNEATKIF